jgi:hypothetical protein
MPREFLKPKRRREPKGNAKQIVRAEDRMIRTAVRGGLRACAKYEESHWPAPQLERVRD